MTSIKNITEFTYQSLIITAIAVGFTVMPFAGIFALTTQAAHSGSTVYVDASAGGSDNGSQADPYDTIQEGVNHANSGDTIDIAAGNYDFVDISKDGLTIKGAGMSNTKLSGNQWNIDAVNVTLKDFTLNAPGANILIRGNMEADGLHIENVKVSDEQTTTIGLNISADGGSETAADKADGLHVENFQVINPSVKGIYLERANNATLRDVLVDGVQYTGNENPPSNGIDINVKYDDYENITIEDSVVRGVERDDFGNGPTWNAAVAIKARDDGSYSGTPATLDNVTLDDVEITDSIAGLRIGEPGVDYTGSPAGPTNVSITNSTFNNNEAYQVEDLPGSLDMQATLNDNTLDQAVAIDRLGSSLLGTIWSSIQDGVDNAQSDDTVQVGSGTYTETVDIDTSNLTLVGVEGPSETTIRSSSGNGILIPGHTGEFEGITVEGFTLEAPSGFAFASYSDGDTDFDNVGLTVRNLVVDGNEAQYGFGLYDVKDVLMDNVTVENIDWKDGGAIEVAGASNLFVQDSDLKDNEVGFKLKEGNPSSVYPTNQEVAIDGSVIEGNTNGVSNSDSNVTVDATENWWGAASGPSGEGDGGGDSVSTNVDYEPWLCDEAPSSNTSQDGICVDLDDDENEKVPVCHAPPGNPDNAHTIYVSENAVSAHQNHGDELGECSVEEEGDNEIEGGGHDKGVAGASDSGKKKGKSKGKGNSKNKQ